MRNNTPRTSAQIFRMLVDTESYKGEGLTPNKYMCATLSEACFHGIITKEEKEEAQLEIRVFMEMYLKQKKIATLRAAIANSMPGRNEYVSAAKLRYLYRNWNKRKDIIRNYEASGNFYLGRKS